MAWIYVDNLDNGWVSVTKPTVNSGGFNLMHKPADATYISIEAAEILLNTTISGPSEPVEIVVKPKETNPIDVSDALKDAYKGGFESATQVLLAAYEEIKTR